MADQQYMHVDKLHFDSFVKDRFLHFFRKPQAAGTTLPTRQGYVFSLVQG